MNETMQMIRIMVKMQIELNVFTNGVNWRSGITDEHRIINWRRCMMMELVEMLDSTNWKHWKQINKNDDNENIKIELTDIFHFLISETVVTCKSTGVAISALTSGSMIAKEINNPFSLGETMIHNLTNSKFDLNQFIIMFFELCKYYDFSLEDLYTLYLGKNVLNKFRQDHGYKDGTYVKMWNGVEDNVVMQETLESLDEITEQSIYGLLNLKYILVLENLKEETFKDRLDIELKELEEKYENLMSFMTSENYKELDIRPAYLLIEQSKLMNEYINILTTRIKEL